VEMAICALLAVEPVGKENEKNARVYSWQSFLSRHLEMNFKRGLSYTMCNHRLPKLLKSNRKIDVIKACNMEAVYTLVTHGLLMMVK